MKGGYRNWQSWLALLGAAGVGALLTIGGQHLFGGGGSVRGVRSAATTLASTTSETGGTTATTAARTQTAGVADGRQPGYIHRVDVVSRTVTVDLIQYFSGQAASQAAREDGKPPPPNDYYIRNVNPAVYSLPIADSAAFSVLSSEPESGDNPEPKTVDFAAFASIANGKVAKGQTEANPWWLTVVHGTVVHIEEQFRP